MRILLSLIVTFSAVVSYADESRPLPDLPNLPITSVCTRWLLGLPVLTDSYSRAMLRLNYEVRRINQALTFDKSTWADGAATYFQRHFDVARDRELDRLDVVRQVELIARLLNYDDLHTPTSYRSQGFWDNPWRANGRHPIHSPDPLTETAVGAHNSREIIDLIDAPGAWNHLRQREAHALIERLVTMVDQRPDLFRDAFRAATAPLAFDPHVGAVVILGHLGRMFSRPGLDAVRREGAVDEAIATLKRAIAEHDVLRIDLGWKAPPKNSDVGGATAYLRAKMDQQDLLMRAAIQGLGELRKVARSCP